MCSCAKRASRAAIASLGLGNPEALWVLPAMLAGVALQRWQALRLRTAIQTSR